MDNLSLCTLCSNRMSCILHQHYIHEYKLGELWYCTALYWRYTLQLQMKRSLQAVELTTSERLDSTLYYLKCKVYNVQSTEHEYQVRQKQAVHDALVSNKQTRTLT